MLETDEKGRIKLSMKALLERPEGMRRAALRARDVATAATVRRAATVTTARAATAKTARAARRTPADAAPAMDAAAAPCVADEAPKQPE